VDERKVIYALERMAGGIYTLEYTGPEALT